MKKKPNPVVYQSISNFHQNFSDFQKKMASFWGVNSHISSAKNNALALRNHGLDAIGSILVRRSSHGTEWQCYGKVEEN